MGVFSSDMVRAGTALDSRGRAGAFVATNKWEYLSVSFDWCGNGERKLGKCSGCQSIKLFNLFMKQDKTMSRI